MLLLCQVEQEIDHGHSWSFPFPSCESSQSYVASCRTHILEALSQLSTLASVEMAIVSPPSPFRCGCCLLIFVPHLDGMMVWLLLLESPPASARQPPPLVTTPSLWGLSISSGHCHKQACGIHPCFSSITRDISSESLVIWIPLLSSQRCFILSLHPDLSLILQESYSCKQQKIQFQLAQKQIYWLRWLKIQTQV